MSTWIFVSSIEIWDPWWNSSILEWFQVDKDSGEPKYDYLIKKKEDVGIKHGNISQLIELYSDLVYNPDIL